MAIVACKECGNPVSTEAKACPKCGAPVPSLARTAGAAASGIWTAAKVGVALLLLVVVFSCVTALSGIGDRDAKTATGSAPPPTTPRGSAGRSSPPDTSAATPPPSRGWDYSAVEDPLTKKPINLAVLESTDSLSLEFPYQGRNKGSLTIRRSQRAGLDAMFSIEKGQLICGYGVGDCRVKVSFDGAAPVTFSMTRSADSSSTLLFFSDAKRLVELLSRAKEIRVAAVVFKAGEPTLTFNSDTPLVWAAK